MAVGRRRLPREVARKAVPMDARAISPRRHRGGSRGRDGGSKRLLEDVPHHPEMWRCKPAHSCRPTQDRMGKCGARCGAGSRTLAFLAPLVWHHGFKCSRPTRGRRGNARCGDATQSSSLVDYDKLRQGRGLSVGVAGFGTSNVEYLCSPALRTCGCECCVCVLCVRTCRCLL